MTDTKKSGSSATKVASKALAPASRPETDLERFLDDLRFGWPHWFRSGRRLFEREALIHPPAIDILDEKDHLVVKAELPGMSKEDIKVELSDSTLTIRGEKKHEKEVKEENYYRSEREYGSVFRSVHLPAEVNRDSVTAALKDGVLEIRMAKATDSKRKAVTVAVK